MNQLPWRLEAVVPTTTSYAQHQIGVSQTWKTKGSLLEEMAALICQAADPNTAVVVRTLCLQNLRGKFDGKHLGEDQDERCIDQRFFQLCAIPLSSAAMILVIQVEAEKVEARIQMSHLLLHMHFLVGLNKPGGDQCTLFGMVDTGAGLNLRWLEYH